MGLSAHFKPDGKVFSPFFVFKWRALLRLTEFSSNRVMQKNSRSMYV